MSVSVMYGRFWKSYIQDNSFRQQLTVLIDNPLKMNTESIYQHTGSIRSSNPLHLGTCMNYSQELDRLTSSYNKEHGPENISRGNYLRERWVKPSSRRLLGGTVEDAEDLTGQRTVASSDR